MDFHSGGDTDREGETGLRSEVEGEQVSQDMERIFGATKPLADTDTAREAQTTTAIIDRSSHARAERRGSERSLALTGFLIAGALAFVLAQQGVRGPIWRSVAKPLPPPTSQVAQIYPAPAPAGAEAVAAAPKRKPNHLIAKSSGVSAHSLVSPSNTYRKRASTARLAMNSGTNTARTMASRSAGRTAAAMRSRHKTRPAAQDLNRKSTQLATGAASRTPGSHADETCAGLSHRDLAWCMRPQVLDADRQLRDAYQEAVRAGVDRSLLSNYRRQWSKLRGRANSDPRSVTGGYRQMAQQLDAARTGHLAGGF
jgi:uncharacterized protein YecT (DUF1311 family)